MGARRVALLTPYLLTASTVNGGAQRVCAQLCDALTRLGHRCTVLVNSRWSASLDPSVDPFGGSMTMCTRWGATTGTVATGAAAERALRRADLVLAVDRCVGRLPSSASKILVLSNLAYENERCALSARWDQVWVPSSYLRDRLRSMDAETSIQVIVPSISGPKCSPLEHRPLLELVADLRRMGVPRGRHLVFPHRMDSGKGIVSAVALLQRLIRRDRRWLLTASAPTTHEGSAAGRLAMEATLIARRGGFEDRLRWLPWLPASEMNCLYASAGCTLMASTLDEGFGLVPLESVAAGVPVVATPSGNVRASAADWGPAICLVDDLDTGAAADVVTRVASSSVPDSFRIGVLERYSSAAQVRQVDAALQALEEAT